MPLRIIRQDITKMKCDAIVNAANETLLGGGGVDGMIHAAAGPRLLEECRGLGGCMTGDAKITRGYDLPAKYVIHTVGPVWRGGACGEREKLISCYRRCLELAKKKRCRSVAFPLVSAGVFGYPKDEALRIAVDTISAFLMENDMEIYITVFSRSGFNIGMKLFADIQSFIDDRYVEAHTSPRLENARRMQAKMAQPCFMEEALCESMAMPMTKASLEDVLSTLDESFTQMLLRKIDESGMTDAQCYKKANIDRKLFSKIRSNVSYKPTKPTALAFAIALELPLEETRDLLGKAGFALSHSSRFDIIIEYFIANGNYNIFEINEALFAFDQPLLGA